MADPDYFTMEEFRALPQMGDAQRYPDPRVEASAAYIIGVIEREVDASFIERTVTDEQHNGGRLGIVLDQAYAREVISLTVAGVAVALDTITLADGVVRLTSGGLFDGGRGEVLVTYTHGYSTTPPADVKAVAMKGTRADVIASSDGATIDDRRKSLNTEAGTVEFVVAGGEEHPTGYPEVDATIVAWRDRLDVDGWG